MAAEEQYEDIPFQEGAQIMIRGELSTVVRIDWPLVFWREESTETVFHRSFVADRALFMEKSPTSPTTSPGDV